MAAERELDPSSVPLQAEDEDALLNGDEEAAVVVKDQGVGRAGGDLDRQKNISEQQLQLTFLLCQLFHIDKFLLKCSLMLLLFSV